MEVYEGIITFNDVAPIQGKTTSRFFGYIKMKDTEGDENSYSMVSFRSQVINQSVKLGKNGMQGMNVKVKGTFEMNNYNQQWQIKVEELFIKGMEQLGQELNHADTPIPQKPSNVPLPTNPTEKLVEHIPAFTSVMPLGPQSGPGSITGGYVASNPVSPTGPGPSGPSGPSGFVGGYVAQTTTQFPMQPSHPIQVSAMPQPLNTMIKMNNHMLPTAISAL